MRDATGAYRHVVVVGGTSEIAREVVQLLCASGTRLITTLSRNPAAALAALPDNVRHRAIEFNTHRPEDHVAIAEEVARDQPDIDLVLVATGMLGDSDRAAQDPVHAAEIITTTFTGTATMTGALASVLAGQGHGTIVVLSSVAGVRVRADNHVYGAAKAGLDGFCQGLAQRLDGVGVDMVLVRPGFVRTRMTEGLTPAPFAIDPARVASDLVKGLRVGRSVVYSPRVLGPIMAILRLLPPALFRRVVKSAQERH